MPIETLFTNGVIVPMTGETARSTTVAIERGRIVFMGDHVPDALAAEAKHRVDLGGKALLPGLVDAHAYSSAAGALVGDVDVSHARSFREIEETLLTARRRGLKGRWPLLVSGVEPTRLSEGRLPDTDWMQHIEPRRPALLISADGEAAAANEVLLAATRAESANFPAKPSYHRTQWMAEEAHALLRWALEHRGRRLEVGGLLGSCRATLDEGTTCLLSAEGSSLSAAQRARRFSRQRTALPLRVVPYYEAAATEARLLCAREVGGCFARVRSPRPTSPIDASIDRFGAALGLHGALRASTAATLRSTEETSRWVRGALRAGLQPALLALDAGSLETALCALEDAFQRARLVDVRPRIIGCINPTREQIGRMAEIGAAVTTATATLDLARPQARRLREEVGPDAFTELVPHKSLLRSGVLWSLGSFAPCSGMSPLHAAAAALRHPSDDERVSPYEALCAVTADSARAAFEETERGTLALGKRADFVVLSGDPILAGERLASLDVVAVYVNGRRFEPQPVHLSRFYWGAFTGRLRESLGV